MLYDSRILRIPRPLLWQVLEGLSALDFGLRLNQPYQFLDIERRPFIRHPGSSPDHRHNCESLEVLSGSPSCIQRKVGRLDDRLRSKFVSVVATTAILTPFRPYRASRSFCSFQRVLRSSALATGIVLSVNQGSIRPQSGVEYRDSCKLRLTARALRIFSLSGIAPVSRATASGPQSS